MLVPSVVIPEKWHNKIQICFHRNSSLGLCQCEKDDWRSIHKGLWSSTMSPYELKFVDVKFVGRDSGSVTVTLDEVSQGWRYVLLAVGISLLFLASVVSTWIPFYCTSSMAIARDFYQPKLVSDFVQDYLGRDISRPLSEQDRLKDKEGS